MKGIRLVGYVARRGKKERCNTSSGEENLKERECFKHLNLGGVCN
jgi:hypothetical protein